MIVLPRLKQHILAEPALIVTVAFYGLIAVMHLRDFVQLSSANFVIGCLGLPFMLPGTLDRSRSRRYGYAACFFCLLYFFLPVMTCLYVTLVCALLFVYESVKGRTSFLPFITLLLMSPIAQYFADAFSFTLRLRLTTFAGWVLQFLGVNAAVSGNVIACNGSEFSVDPACMGLHMLLSALLCCLLIIAVQQKRLGKELSVWWVALICLLAIALNVLLNLVRILILVQFSIMPDTIMHELVGVFCLILYVIIPALVGLQWLVKRVGKAPPVRRGDVTHSYGGLYGLHLAIALLMSGGILAAGQSMKPSSVLPIVPGYAASHYDTNGIVKLEHSAALVYLKELPGFYCSEHHPMLCWTGGGYLFKQVEESVIAGVPVMSGTLEKGAARLYTAWWYSNGKARTSSGLGWRWDALRNGGHYSIVNVTAADEATLSREIAALVSSKALNGWIARGGR